MSLGPFHKSMAEQQSLIDQIIERLKSAKVLIWTKPTEDKIRLKKKRKRFQRTWEPFFITGVSNQ